MINKIKKIIKNPRKAWRYLNVALEKKLCRKKGILVIIGLDSEGDLNLLHPGYKMCYGFEANPIRFDKLVYKYKENSNIKLYNVAVSDYDGEIDFNISNNNEGASSSIGNFSEDWLETQHLEGVKMIAKIKIPCINLLNFFHRENINFIDDYVSDIQGMDLQVLKTLRPFINGKQIATIRCEVTKNKYKNIYHDLPDNSEYGFHELLAENYQLVAKGWGILKDNKFDKISESTWEMDCKWRLKTS